MTGFPFDKSKSVERLIQDLEEAGEDSGEDIGRASKELFVERLQGRVDTIIVDDDLAAESYLNYLAEAGVLGDDVFRDADFPRWENVFAYGSNVLEGSSNGLVESSRIVGENALNSSTDASLYDSRVDGGLRWLSNASLVDVDAYGRAPLAGAQYAVAVDSTIEGRRTGEGAEYLLFIDCEVSGEEALQDVSDGIAVNCDLPGQVSPDLDVLDVTGEEMEHLREYAQDNNFRAEEVYEFARQVA